jgi:hypothetical protein
MTGFLAFLDANKEKGAKRICFTPAKQLAIVEINHSGVTRFHLQRRDNWHLYRRLAGLETAMYALRVRGSTN